MISKRFFIAITILLAIMIGGCSSGRVVSPTENPSFTSEQSSCMDWGSYELYFNPSTGETNIIYGREASGHINLTDWLVPPACGGNGCITAGLVSWDTATNIATFNVKITNPTVWAATDIRLIFYNLAGKEILNPDSYTRTYVPTISPFIAYAKTLPNRMFPASGSVTETVKIYWPPFASFTIYFRITAWLWLNCEDPYEINGMFQNGKLTPGGGNATIGCNVLDWQNNVTSVTVDTTSITRGITNLSYVGMNKWQANITNSANAPVGDYKCLITAKSPNPQNYDLYNYIWVRVSEPSWVKTLSKQLPEGPCSLDFGIIPSPQMKAHALVARVDSQGQCSEIWKYPGWENPPVFYASLRNLDPTNPNFQPWPVARIDAASNGAFGWTNDNINLWLTGPNWVQNKQTYCNMDNDLIFLYDPEIDDNRHYIPLWGGATSFEPIDTCNTFETIQCSIYRYLDLGLVGFHGILGALEGGDYTDFDIRWNINIFPGALIGEGAGRIDPSDIVGIDAMLGRMSNYLILFVAERVNREIEVFTIVDTSTEPEDIIYHNMTIPVRLPTGLPATPVDIELLPPNNMYTPCPMNPILCVLIDNAQFPSPPPGFGGSILIFNADTGAWVDQIGDSTNPAVTNPPMFLDTFDAGFEIHVMTQGPVVSVFNFI